MDGIPPELKLEPSVDVQKPTTSLLSRLFNVLAAPGEVFEEVKNSKPSAANWLVPLVIYILAGIIATMVMFSQPAIVQQIHDQQTKAFDDQVKAGKMTQTQADQAQAMSEKFTGPGMLKIFGSVGVVVFGFVRLFWWAFVLWLLQKIFLKANIPFTKLLEAAGLAMMVEVLAIIVGMLLTVLMGHAAEASLALADSAGDASTLKHQLLSVVNLFNLWEICVLAVALACFSGAKFSRPLVLVGGFWLLEMLVLIGFGQLFHGIKIGG